MWFVQQDRPVLIGEKQDARTAGAAFIASGIAQIIEQRFRFCEREILWSDFSFAISFSFCPVFIPPA
jgi:hypothetical protein